MDFWLVQDTSRGGDSCPLYGSTLCGEIAASVPNNGSLPWVVSQMSMRTSDVYYIVARGDNEGFNSHYINITEASPSTSTATSLPGPTSTLSPSQTFQAVATPSSSPSSQASTSQPVGAIVDGVVGGVAGVGIIAVLSFLLYGEKKKQKQASGYQGVYVLTPYSEPMEDPWKPEVQAPHPEMDDTSRCRS
ncbi:hypothetical protein BGW36DRAFT_429071 [Talaromyces proteolyticus]|uniref:Mid2 domain-containing protein n=1 Tax=Talaromyces proteolyticus TaxID=1131652 RepID=A0AAD4PYI0_9EURO|nr:uncharacterized protein BGW36DRAFT_429071 [Talaromyces proteolyticus]KAH8695188.1 hypothetical protein BGW36DRAFT_429071 [Talaromyces proteolyticus]